MQYSASFYVYYHFCSSNSVNVRLPSCSTLEHWVRGLHSGEKGTLDFSERYVYKFVWNASPIHIFIRPDFLQTLSMYMFQVHFPEAHLIFFPTTLSQAEVHIVDYVFLISATQDNFMHTLDWTNMRVAKRHMLCFFVRHATL